MTPCQSSRSSLLASMSIWSFTRAFIVFYYILHVRPHQSMFKVWSVRIDSWRAILWTGEYSPHSRTFSFQKWQLVGPLIVEPRVGLWILIIQSIHWSMAIRTIAPRRKSSLRDRSSQRKRASPFILSWFSIISFAHAVQWYSYLQEEQISRRIGISRATASRFLNYWILFSSSITISANSLIINNSYSLVIWFCYG